MDILIYALIFAFMAHKLWSILGQQAEDNVVVLRPKKEFRREPVFDETEFLRGAKAFFKEAQKGHIDSLKPYMAQDVVDHFMVPVSGSVMSATVQDVLTKDAMTQVKVRFVVDAGSSKEAFCWVFEKKDEEKTPNWTLVSIHG